MPLSPPLPMGGGGVGGGGPPSSTLVADAQGRAAREIKLRQASEARRVALEEELERCKGDLRAQESARMAQSREIEEARHAIGLVETLGKRSQAAEAALEELRRGGSTSAASAAAAASATAAVKSLSSTLERLLSSVVEACNAGSRLSPPLGEVSLSLTSASLTSPVPALGAVGAGDPPLDPPLATLCLRGNKASSAVGEVVVALGLVVEGERVKRVGAEREVEERSKLIRDWQKYAEHWEARGREAEALVGEWQKAYAGNEKARVEAVNALKVSHSAQLLLQQQQQQMPSTPTAPSSGSSSSSSGGGGGGGVGGGGSNMDAYLSSSPTLGGGDILLAGSPRVFSA